MNNTINAMLRHVYNRIPEEILLEGFRQMMQETHRTLDAVVKESIIIDIVLHNCNLYAGKTKKIVLYQDYVKNAVDTMLFTVMGGDYGIYQIPPEARENRPISAVLDLAYPTTMAFYGAYPNIDVTGRSVTNAADEVLASATRSPMYVSPTPMLIDGQAGIIQMSPPAAVHIDWILSCMLAYDKNLTNISPNIMNHLKYLTEYAAKSYIYNKLIVKVNQGFISQGMQLEAIRSIIESYADAYDRFEEYLLKFRGASNFSTDIFRDFISLLVGS